MKKKRYSNCAGDATCTCNSNFSNCAGCTTFSNCCGATSNFNNAVGLIAEEQPVQGVTLTATTPTIQTVGTLPGTTPVQTTVSTQDATFGEKFSNTLQDVFGAIALFGSASKSAQNTTATAPAPADQKEVPMMVWVALGIIGLLLVVFLAVKLNK